MANFQKKLKFLKREIKHWNHTTFGNIFKAQAALHQEMKLTQQRIITEGSSEELEKQEQVIEDQLLNRAQQEEILWRQKSRIRWLKEGEKNTKFFHKTMVQRRMHNLISHIHNDQGERIETHEGIEENFLRYFKKVHQESSIDRLPAIEKILQQIPKLITDEHNLLLQPILLHEVDNTVKQLKAESRALRWMYPGLNATFMALIPKTEEANTPDKYRLIALCNIIYRIVSKVIATQLKPLLPLNISPEQSGYVEGRQITDEIILTHEIIHSLKQTKKPGLGRNIKSAIFTRCLKGLSFNNSPSFSHQQFVDDNMLYGHPSVQESLLFRDILSSFSDASDALINRVKSQIFFFNTPVSTQRSIARILGFTIASLPSKYLGAPMIASALKHSSWRDLLEKLEAKLFLWTHGSLNMASRVVLIKAILQSMPLYLFSLLAVPKWVVKAIRNLQRNFLWGSSGHNKKWALVKWEKVCLPKKSGGIGIRDPQHSNTQRTHPLETANQFSSSSTTQKHRKWKGTDQIIREKGYEITQQTLSDKLKKRKIPIAVGADILRWGYEERGTFTTKEAYNIITNDKIIKDNLWDQIWSSTIWPKVSTFLWLLSHNRILTWDNLRKRKFSGPSICPNCKQAEETVTHLLQTCHLGRKLWEKAIFRCQRDNRVQGDLKATLCNWKQSPYHSRLLNSLWQLIPGLLMWNIWKERNRRLFKNQTQTLEQIWTILHRNIKESLSIHDWSSEDFPTYHKEKSIWDNWKISLLHNPNSHILHLNRHKKSTTWSPPPHNLFQLNFDGASKGNPGQSGYGGVSGIT
eukprot:PITA_33170